MRAVIRDFVSIEVLIAEELKRELKEESSELHLDDESDLCEVFERLFA